MKDVGDTGIAPLARLEMARRRRVSADRYLSAQVLRGRAAGSWNADHRRPPAQDCGGGTTAPPPPISLQNLVDFGWIPRTPVNSANGGNCHRQNALAPEVARHQ